MINASQISMFQFPLLMYLLILSMVALADVAALPDQLLELQSLSKQQAGEHHGTALKTLASVRSRAQRQSAYSLGAGHGLIWRNEHIKQHLNALRPTLDTIFNFEHLMIDSHIVPPVIIRAEQVSLQETDKAVRQTGTVMKIKQQARIAHTPPIWERYLIADFPSPPLPHPEIFPQEAEEQTNWAAWVAEGWQAGVHQADAIFADNLHRLKRDLTGMLRYHLLVKRGYVSSPFLDETNNGAVIEGDTLRIDDTLLTLTQPAGFTSPDTWLPVLSDKAIAPYTRWSTDD